MFLEALCVIVSNLVAVHARLCLLGAVMELAVLAVLAGASGEMAALAVAGGVGIEEHLVIALPCPFPQAFSRPLIFANECTSMQTCL